METGTNLEPGLRISLSECVLSTLANILRVCDVSNERKFCTVKSTSTLFPLELGGFCRKYAEQVIYYDSYTHIPPAKFLKRKVLNRLTHFCFDIGTHSTVLIYQAQQYFDVDYEQ
jgi:hypothetical protein